MLTNLFTQQGLVYETCDPYVDYDTTCNTSCESQYYITDWNQLGPIDKPAEIDLIKQKLFEHGPLYTQMDPKISGFSSYGGGYVLSGISTDPNKWTHGVLIVGWDDNLPYTGGKGAWIVKNSYGTEWGNDGYFTIAYGKAGIGSSLATVTGWNVVSSFNNLHFFDEAGYTKHLTVSDLKNASGMSLFEVKPNEILRAVEFWTNDAAVVSFEIYEQFDGNEPVRLLYQSKDIDIPYAGYHQIEINQYLVIPANSEIVVVLNVKNKFNSNPLVLDDLGPLSSDKTWYKDSEGKWKSLPAWQDQNFEGTIRLRSLVIPEGLNHKIFLPIVSKK